MYQLKDNQPAFEVVDGELAGRSFKHGVVYDEVPASEAYRFDVVGTPQEAQPAPGAEDEGGERQ